MKKITSTFVIAFTMVLLAACGDNQEDNAADAQRHLRAATTYQEQGQLRAAMLEARNAVRLQPDQAEGYIVLGRVYNTVGAYASTQSLLEPVVEDLPQTSIELAEAYIATKKFRSALNLLNSHPASSDADKLRQARILGIANIALGDKEGYEKVIQSLQGVEGAATEEQYLQASYTLSQGNTEEALKILETAVEQSPEHQKSLILLGEISLYSDQLDKAERYLTQALSKNPGGDVMTVDRATILGHLTQVLIRQGRTSEAYTYQKILAEANPESQVVQQKFSDAMELYQQGKFEEAEALLKEIHEQFPGDKNTGTLLGLAQYQQGEDEAAIDLFDQFIDTETTNSTVIQAAAVAKYRSNKIDEAIELLKSAAENQPNDAAILATYGLALLDRDETSSEGALALEKSLALNPGQQRLRIVLAKRHMAMGKEEQAIAQLEKAYKEQPLDLVIQQTYLKALLAQGNIEQVEADIADFQRTYPENSRGPFLEGWFKVQQEEYKAAQKAFEKSLSMKNNDEKGLSYSGLAQAYELDDQIKKATTTWQLALTEDPSLAIGYSRYLGMMQSQNNIEDAVAFLTELEKNSTAWHPSVALAQVAANQRQTEQAIKHMDIALERAAGNEQVERIAANLYNQRALELRSQKQIQPSRVNSLKALELSPGNVTFLANLIDTELSEKNIAEAQKLLDQFPQTDEGAAAQFFLQGAIHRADNKPDAALKAFRQSWDARPSDNSAEAIYAHYQNAGQTQEANKFVDQWIDKIPASPKPTLLRAVAAQQGKRVDEAIQWYEKTLELAPNMPAAINNLAWIYYEQKDPRALETAERAYKLAPNSAPILDTYGWILVEQGKVAEGINHLQQAAKIAPDNEEIKGHLNEARARSN